MGVLRSSPKRLQRPMSTVKVGSGIKVPGSRRSQPGTLGVLDLGCAVFTDSLELRVLQNFRLACGLGVAGAPSYRSATPREFEPEGTHEEQTEDDRAVWRGVVEDQQNEAGEHQQDER